MKRIVFSLAAVAALAVCGMTKAERQHLRMLAERPRCEARERVVIGGTTNIVETWRRGGYEWKQTNAVRRVIGIVQRNTFEEKVAEARALAAEYETDAKAIRDLRKSAKKTAKNLEKLRKNIEKAKKQSQDADELAFYTALEQLVMDAQEGN